jgi:ADP-ribose pyrophosphatase
LKIRSATTLSTRRIYEGDRISLRIDRVKMGANYEVEREVAEHRGSVVLVPLTDRGTVLLVRQWRQPAGEVLLEAPAGTLDPDEQPEACAQRELQEETGHRAAKLTRLPGFWVAPGWCTEYMHAFLATGLSPASLPQDEDEDVHVEETPLSRVPGLIKSGAIQDAKSIASLLCAVYLDSEHFQLTK